MRPIKVCRACKSANLTEFLDLGRQRLSDFREDDKKTPAYPIVAVFCEDCKLVQLLHTTPQNEMYHDRYGFKSGVSDSIKKDLNDIVTHAFQYKNDPKTWLDIASNDGTLLSYVPTDVYRVGVDPVPFLCEEAEQHADVIINNYFDAKDFAPEEWSYDVITSISCFYDMPDPNKFVADVKSVLGDKGIWIIQQNYLLTTMELNAVDNFCHEHLEYYTLLSLENLLEKHDLEVIEVQLSMVNGGSIRTVVAHKDKYAVDPSVFNQRAIESAWELDTIQPYGEYSERVGMELEKLRSMIVDLVAQGKKVAILAASTRGATIWQSAGIDNKLICYAVERNPAKVGKNFTAIGVPIVSEEYAREDKPDYMIIGPWFFADEIVKREQEYLKEGGQLIIPLPRVSIKSWNPKLKSQPA